MGIGLGLGNQSIIDTTPQSPCQNQFQDENRDQYNFTFFKEKNTTEEVPEEEKAPVQKMFTITRPKAGVNFLNVSIELESSKPIQDYSVHRSNNRTIEQETTNPLIIVGPKEQKRLHVLSPNVQ